MKSARQGKRSRRAACALSCSLLSPVVGQFSVVCSAYPHAFLRSPPDPPVYFSWSGSQSLRSAQFRDVLSHTREGWATWGNDRVISPRYHLGEPQGRAVVGLAVNHHRLPGTLSMLTGAFMR